MCAKVAAVAVEGTTYFYDKLYSYLLPENFAAQAGCRVIVPFGRGNRSRQGIVINVSNTDDVSKMKPIMGLVDIKSMISEELIKLALYLREHTFCTYFDALRMMLPAGISLRMVRTYRAADSDLLPQDGDKRRLVQHLRECGSALEKAKLDEIFGMDMGDLLEKLVKDGLITRSDEAVRRMGDATVKMMCLTENTEGKVSPKQKAVLDLLFEIGSASVREVCYFTGVTAAVATALEKKGMVRFYENEVYRNPYSEVGSGTQETIKLTESQQAAYDTLLEKYDEEKGAAALLYGVTGSGKTSVFLKMVDKAHADGKGVIVMVPEISLTPQTLEIFHKRYGRDIAVFHSAMSLGQRMDEWKRVKKGDAKIVIGTRSAIFAPVQNLGLIIIDEEQEHTYKSESNPRFHARDAAKFRVFDRGALLILSSATPSIESFTAAKKGKYTLVRLDKRYGTAVLPKVVTVDMKEELLSGNTGSLSATLNESIRETLNNGNQAILLLNRRGHNTMVTCRTCAEVMTCPSCSISLRYHSANGRLMCHYCGYSEDYNTKCPNCGGEHIRFSGLGTQKAQEELQAIYPNARILRMDADSTMTKNAYEEKLSAFGRGDYDIMLGTQMVAKGLDFERVTLVGVLNADSSLYSDDYRSFERTFSLLTQVVGRSGRGKTPGTAVIQTMNPESSVILLAEKQDYDAFYEQEIAARKLMIFPPYCDICLLGFVDADRNAAKTAADEMFKIIKTLSEKEFEAVKLFILGPSVATVPKISGKYRYRMILKCINNKVFRGMLETALIKYSQSAIGKKVTVFTDINPEGII